MARNFLVDSNTIIYGSQQTDGSVAQWLLEAKPWVSSISLRECLDDWPLAKHPRFASQRQWLELFFGEVQKHGRLIDATEPAILSRASALEAEGVQPDDARIAATAELRQLTLLTADTRKNFVPRLLKLNQQGRGNFLVLSYAYANREVFFGAVMELLNDEGTESGPQ